MIKLKIILNMFLEMMDLLNSVDYIFLKVFEDDEALSISTCIFSSIALVLLHTSANG